MHNVSQGNPVELFNTISIMNRMIHHCMLSNIDIYTYLYAIRTDIGGTIIMLWLGIYQFPRDLPNTIMYICV